MTEFIFTEPRTWYRLLRACESNGRKFSEGQVFWPAQPVAGRQVEWPNDPLRTHLAVSLSIDGMNLFLVPAELLEPCRGVRVEF